MLAKAKEGGGEQAPPPLLVVLPGENGATQEDIQPKLLDTVLGWQFWRFELVLPLLR